MPVMPTDYRDPKQGIRLAAELANKYEREIADSGYNYHAYALRDFDRQDSWPSPRKPFKDFEKQYESMRQSDNHRRIKTIEDLKHWIDRLNEPPRFPNNIPCTLSTLQIALREASNAFASVGSIHAPESYTVTAEYTRGDTFNPSIFKSLQIFYGTKLKAELDELTARRDTFLKELNEQIPQLPAAQLQSMLTTYQEQLAVEAAKTSPPQAEYTCPYCAAVRTVIQTVQAHLPPEPTTVRISAQQADFATFRLLAAADETIPLDYMRQLLNAIAASRLPEIEFALAATSEEIYPLVHLPAAAAATFEGLLRSYFPKAVLEQQSWTDFPQTCTAHDSYVFNGPHILRPFADFNPDPYAAFCAGMETTLQPGEFALVSIRFDRLSEAMLTTTALSFWQQGVEDIYRHKKGSPAWAVAIETFIAAEHPNNPAITEQRAGTIRQAIERHLFGQIQLANGPLVRRSHEIERERFKRDYSIHKVFEIDPALMARAMLSTDELAGLVHLPHKSITSPLLQRANMIDQKPPDFVTGPNGLLLGTCAWRRQNIEIRLPQHVRSRHMYTLGASGSGKSTLLLNMIVQDMTSGAGLAVIDPHGDLIAKILPHIPKARLADVILFNAADYDHPIALNPLQARTRREQEQVRDEFMALFTRLFVSGDAPRMLHILRFTITTLIQAGNKTFFDIRRLLINSEFRRSVLSTITDPHVLEFWQQEFPSFPKSATDPIVNKLSQFTLSTTVHNILAQAKSQINFYDLMQERKIFLASLPPDIGEENAHLLGSLIVAQIQMAAMRRSAIPEQQRVPFTLYVDEFQNFMSSGFEKILSEARKYQLSLVLAHQYITQLQDNVRAAIFANTHTRVFFQVSPQDANTVRTLLGTATPEQLVSFPRGQALVTMPACNPFMLRTFPDPPQPANNFIQHITDASRQRYSSRPEPAAAPAPDLNATPQPTSESSESAATTFATRPAAWPKTGRSTTSSQAASGCTCGRGDREEHGQHYRFARIF